MTGFFRTKKLIVDVIRIQAGENLPEILETPSTAPQVFTCAFFYDSCTEILACFNIIC